MGYPLYGHELDENTTPIEAGVGFFVALDKGEFVGRPVMAAQKAQGVARRSVAFKMTGPSAPPRAGYAVWKSVDGAELIGTVTSGTLSPSLGVGIGMAMVPVSLARPGTALAVEVRGRRYAAEVVPKPIYRRAAAAPSP
jgi:aminomethyltransferase